MKKNLITIEVEGEHVAWINELNEIKEELERYEIILAKISSPHNNKNIEHFQNQFLIQQNAVDQLKNEIKKHDLAIERNGDQPFDSVKFKAIEYHTNINQKVDIEVKIFEELKKEFAAFVEAE